MIGMDPYACCLPLIPYGASAKRDDIGWSELSLIWALSYLSFPSQLTHLLLHAIALVTKFLSIQLVCTQGSNNWVQISQHIQHRSPKQCRERYHQNLQPSLNHEQISTQEGEPIEQTVNEMGKRWAEIAQRLRNQSGNAVKNWWNGSMNRRKCNVMHHGHSMKGECSGSMSTALPSPLR